MIKEVNSLKKIIVIIERIFLILFIKKFFYYKLL